MAKFKEIWAYTALSAAGMAILTLFGLIWVPIFMIYRILTWPFRLVGRWLRAATARTGRKG